MQEALRAVVGDVTFGEVALVAVVFALILLYSRAPKIGEALGGLLGGDGAERDEE